MTSSTSPTAIQSWPSEPTKLLNDTEWFERIHSSGGVLVFDAANRTAVKMIAKTWLKSAKIQDVGAYFAVSDAKSELSLWNPRLRVSSRGYMLGYNDLRDPSVSGFSVSLQRSAITG